MQTYWLFLKHLQVFTFLAGYSTCRSPQACPHLTVWGSCCALLLWLLLLASNLSQAAASLTCSHPSVTHTMNPYHSVQNSLAKPVLCTGANNCYKISQSPLRTKRKTFLPHKWHFRRKKIYLSILLQQCYMLLLHHLGSQRIAWCLKLCQIRREAVLSLNFF